MRRKIASILIIAGFLFAVWNGYLWVAGSFSGQEAIGENDIIASAEDKNLAPKTEQTPSVPYNESESAASYAEEEILPPPSAKNTESIEEPEPRDYAEYSKGAEIGWLLIPALDMKYLVYWGTDEETLTQGVGYHPGNFTTPPDGLRHTVLSGHRDTVFRGLGELEHGASMYVQFENIQYEYEIQKTWITDAGDRSVIVEKSEPTLTLTTCYPFNFIGSAPDRYIIEATLVDTAAME